MLIRTERDGRVMTVTFDNPPRNFMNGQMVAELDELTRALESDGSIGAVVLTGAVDGIFIMHYDVAEIAAGAESSPSVTPGLVSGTLRAVGAVARMPGAEGALARTPAAGVLELRRIHELFLRMQRMDKVFVAAINGMATGGGCELALACDLRYMADGDFLIGLPEMSLGITPGAGGTQRMARALGPAKAIELILEARPLPPAEALEAGLVHRVLTQAELLAEAHSTAERLARRAPASVAAAKRSVYEGGSRSLPEGLHMERAGFLASAAAPAAIAAMKAYAEQVERLPDGVPSPWGDPEAMRNWQEGTAVDLTA
jgi:enoyl-CoA hydratase/carnithine racemase